MDEDDWGDAGGAVIGRWLTDVPREPPASRLRTGVGVSIPFEEGGYEEVFCLVDGGCVRWCVGSR